MKPEENKKLGEKIWRIWPGKHVAGNVRRTMEVKKKKNGWWYRQDYKGKNYTNIELEGRFVSLR